MRRAIVNIHDVFVHLFLSYLKNVANDGDAIEKKIRFTNVIIKKCQITNVIVTKMLLY